MWKILEISRGFLRERSGDQLSPTRYTEDLSKLIASEGEIKKLQILEEVRLLTPAMNYDWSLISCLDPAV